MLSHTDHILCVEDDQSLRRSRCSILESFGYHTVCASARLAAILLSYQKFDLVVLSVADDHELNRLIDIADGADILVLGESSEPDELPPIVAERLRRLQVKRAS